RNVTGVQTCALPIYLTRGMPTHTISQCQKIRTCIRRVFIISTDQTAVGGGGEIKLQHSYATSLKVERPILISVFTPTCSGWSMRLPEINVPLRDSRSSTNHWLPRRKSRA